MDFSAFANGSDASILCCGYCSQRKSLICKDFNLPVRWDREGGAASTVLSFTENARAYADQVGVSVTAEGCSLHHVFQCRTSARSQCNLARAASFEIGYRAFRAGETVRPTKERAVNTAVWCVRDAAKMERCSTVSQFCRA